MTGIATIDGDVRAKMRSLILTSTLLPDAIGYENVTFKPSVDQDFVKEARLAPLPKVPISFGADVNWIAAEYIYEVHVGTPRGIGPERIEKYAGIILTLCKPATQFQLGNALFTCKQAGRSQLMSPDDYPLHTVVACTFMLASRVLNT